MMLPTDIALIKCPSFAKHVKRYAEDPEAFQADFASAFGKLMQNGCPEKAAGGKAAASSAAGAKAKASNEFREWSMHGSHEKVVELSAVADTHAAEPGSGRTALHKAAFWGHDKTVDFLLKDKNCRLNPDVKDYEGDTALNDAVRFGHLEVARVLLANGASKAVRNDKGQDALAIAKEYRKPAMVKLLS
jgi:ankyrin repeat protein